MPNQPDPVPAALYARVSSDRQDVDLSVAAQLRALRNYAAQHGYVVAREYVDEAESGRIAARPQFRAMLDETNRSQSPFEVILVWKFSRFTRKREHAVAFKALLRRRGVKVVSITEHADDSPTGKLMEAIIESVDEFYSENLAQEVTRGMREAAARGFWMASRAPYGYTRVLVPDGAKQRPKLAVVEPAAGVVRRLFALADRGQSLLDITKTLNAEGVASPSGQRWLKTSVQRVLTNEVYTGTLVWGTNAKDQTPPVRVEAAFPALVSRDQFRRVATVLTAKAPTNAHPRRSASSYLLSGLVTCRRCGRALSGQAAKSGRFAYYVCQSLLHRGSGACDAPRLNARRFEGLIVAQIRDSILTAGNIRSLVRLVHEELDGVAEEQRRKLAGLETEVAEVRRRLDRVWQVIETSDLELADATERIKAHRARQERLERAAAETRAQLSERRAVLDDVETITAYALDQQVFLQASDRTESRAFIQSFVREIAVAPGAATIRYALPLPADRRLPDGGPAVEALRGPVPSTVHVGGPPPRGIRVPGTSDCRQGVPGKLGSSRCSGPGRSDPQLGTVRRRPAAGWRGERAMTSTVPVIRWGIIGAGDIADRVMAPAMHAAPHAELVAIMRRDRSAAADFARRHDVPRVYGSVEAIVADPDIQAIYVATPVDRHLQDTLAAAAQGKHILCEKPMALSSREGEQMRAAGERAGIRFMMCFYQRFNARHRKIKQLLAEGAIGPVTAVRANFSGRSPDVPARWRHDRAQAGGGCYMDNASHCIDLLRFLFGGITAAVAFVDTLAARYAVEDSASSLLRLANGAHAVVTSYWSTGDPDEHRNSMLEIQGTEGTIISTPLHEKFSRGTLTVATQRGEAVYEFEQSTHYAVLEDFAVTVAEGRTPAITASDGIAAMRVVEAVYDSGRSGRVVQLA